MDKSNSLEELFRFLSKITIIIPIVVVAVAFMLRSSNRSTNAANNPYRQMLSVTPVVTAQDSGALNRLNFDSTKGKIDLNGPLVCRYNDKDMQGEAYIKDKNIYATLKQQASQQYFLVKGDCLYQWTSGTYTGEKTCGVGSVLDMVTTLSQLGLFDISTVFQALSQFNVGPSIAISPPSMEALKSSCKKDTVNDSLFDLPQSITFKEITTTP